MDALTDTELFHALAALGWIDRVALAIVVVAALRGVWLGLLREAFSIGALAAAFVLGWLTILLLPLAALGVLAGLLVAVLDATGKPRR